MHWFALLYIFFIPVGCYLFSFQQDITDFLFGTLISLSWYQVFHTHLLHAAISSDSRSMYVLVFLFFVIAIITTALLSLTAFKEKKQKAFPLLQSVFRYYLIMQLFIYGFDKVFKTQFYLPEPNILFTPLGNISRDLLYWSTIG